MAGVAPIHDFSADLRLVVTPAQRFARHYTKKCDRHNDDGPVALDKTCKQPGHRQTHVQEQQRQHDLGGVDVSRAATFRETQRIVIFRECKEHARNHRPNER